MRHRFHNKEGKQVNVMVKNGGWRDYVRLISVSVAVYFVLYWVVKIFE